MKLKLLIITLLFFPLVACADGIEPDRRFIDSKELKIKDNDIVLGSKNAPITFIEYSSLTCPHCANFHKAIFPKLNDEYIKTNKVKYILRDFPLNAPALLAAKVSHCAGNERYMDFIKTYFESQELWAFNNNYAQEIEKIAALGGITGDKYKNCSQSKYMEEFVLNRAMEANKNLNISETPTFFINGEKYMGEKGYDFFKKTFDEILKK